MPRFYNRPPGEPAIQRDILEDLKLSIEYYHEGLNNGVDPNLAVKYLVEDAQDQLSLHYTPDSTLPDGPYANREDITVRNPNEPGPLNPIRLALWEYFHALDTRQRPEVAANGFAHNLQGILDMHWKPSPDRPPPSGHMRLQ